MRKSKSLALYMKSKESHNQVQYRQVYKRELSDVSDVDYMTTILHRLSRHYLHNIWSFCFD